jgi:general secretion pathway protein A
LIYEKFFSLRQEPFGVTPDPRFLYMSKKHEDAIAHLRFGISENKGFIMLTGEIGSGKTTLIRYFLNNLSSETHSSLIMNPMVNPLELLKLINHDFGVICAGDSQKDHLDALNAFLLESFSRNEKALLVIDEAQELSIECLEFIRLLSNLETNTKKLLQVIFIGQPELKRIVASAPLKQLDQRIAVRYHLEPLDLNDTNIYINHRLKIAGGGMVTFPDRGIKRIYKYSHGIPRLINLACDRTLLHSYSEGKIKITTGIVKKALKDLDIENRTEKSSILKPAFIGIAAFIFIIALIYNNISHEDNYLDKISNVLKETKKGEISINDGIYIASTDGLSEDACILNLLNIWEEKDLLLNTNLKNELEKRGYSVYRAGNNFDAVMKFNIPCILHIKQNDKINCVVMRWVVGDDAMLIDPREGKNILPVNTFKDSIKEISLLYKNRFRGDNRIEILQKELKKRGLYDYKITGEFGARTKRALLDFQEKEGLVKTGDIDNETAIILSSTTDTPRLTP